MFIDLLGPTNCEVNIQIVVMQYKHNPLITGPALPSFIPAIKLVINTLLQVMRGFAHFLETVMHDSPRASRLLETSDELEEHQAAARKKSLALQKSDGSQYQDNLAVITVTLDGIIKSASLYATVNSVPPAMFFS